MKIQYSLARLMRMSPVDRAQKNLALRKRMEKLMKLDPATTAKVLQACREGGTMPPGMAARYDAAMRKDEKDFQAAVIKEAKRLGWLCYHTHNSRKSEKGFPDITAVRGHRVLFWELKTETGTCSASQLTWGERLSNVGGNVEYAVIRPTDWVKILEILA